MWHPERFMSRVCFDCSYVNRTSHLNQAALFPRDLASAPWVLGSQVGHLICWASTQDGTLVLTLLNHPHPHPQSALVIYFLLFTFIYSFPQYFLLTHGSKMSSSYWCLLSFWSWSFPVFFTYAFILFDPFINGTKFFNFISVLFNCWYMES